MEGVPAINCRQEEIRSRLDWDGGEIIGVKRDGGWRIEFENLSREVQQEVVVEFEEKNELSSGGRQGRGDQTGIELGWDER